LHLDNLQHLVKLYLLRINHWSHEELKYFSIILFFEK